jgi:hypothetical protein
LPPRHAAAALVVSLLLGGLVRTACAHDRIPATLNVYAGPLAADGPIVSTNFGLFTEGPNGETRWGCERVEISESSRYLVLFEPRLSIFAIGTYFIAASHDGACSW